MRGIVTATPDTDTAPDFAQLATKELLTGGDLPGPEGIAARHRARTWAMLALARATKDDGKPKS